jgi:hypothetical protein
LLAWLGLAFFGLFIFWVGIRVRSPILRARIFPLRIHRHMLAVPLPESRAACWGLSIPYRICFDSHPSHSLTHADTLVYQLGWRGVNGMGDLRSPFLFTWSPAHLEGIPSPVSELPAPLPSGT